MIQRKIGNFIRRQYEKHYHKIWSKTGNMANSHLYDSNTRIPLTTEEKKLLQKKWGDIVPSLRDGYEEYEIYKAHFNFDANYVPYSYYLGSIIDALNPVSEKQAITNKNLYSQIFHNLPQPRTIIKAIDSVLFDANHHIINQDTAEILLASESTPMIIKPTVAVGAGQGISILETSNIKEITTEIGSNFIVQKKVLQSADMAKLNSTSLNTLRITTFLSKSGIKILSKTVRVGSKGSIMDNVATGGIMIGVKDDYRLADCGYDRLLRPVTEHNGFKFGGMYIPNYQKAIDLVIDAHLRLPVCKIVGWDMALDENNMPVFIEANMRRPGITVEQFCTGPIFDGFTDELIDELKVFYKTKQARPFLHYQ